MDGASVSLTFADGFGSRDAGVLISGKPTQPVWQLGAITRSAENERGAVRLFAPLVLPQDGRAAVTP